MRAENCLEWEKAGVHIAKWEVGGVDRADLGQNVLEVICQDNGETGELEKSRTQMGGTRGISGIT